MLPRNLHCRPSPSHGPGNNTLRPRLGTFPHATFVPRPFAEDIQEVFMARRSWMYSVDRSLIGRVDLEAAP